MCETNGNVPSLGTHGKAFAYLYLTDGEENGQYVDRIIIDL